MANIPALPNDSGVSAPRSNPARSRATSHPTEAAQPIGGDDQFHLSPEMTDRQDPGDKRDLSGLKAALGPGQSPSDEELTRAQARGQSANEMKRDRASDQRIVDHVCGEGCGCRPKAGEDPLKALQARDAEVRKHEADHHKEAGDLAASGPTYKTHTASDGRSYVTSGEVQVEVGEVKGSPQKTIDKMNRVEKAALKPEQPSDKDRQVAREAITTRLKAESDLKYKPQAGPHP